MKNMAPCRRGAFTLIELLVVVAIISLLVSLLLPSLQKAKELAKNTVCLSNLKHLNLVMYLYCDDNEEVFVPCYKVPKKSGDYETVFWTQRLIPYTDSGMALVCSLYDRKLDNPGFLNYYSVFSNDGYAQYGYNHRALSCWAELSGWGCYGPKWITPSQLLHPDRLILCLDFTHSLAFSPGCLHFEPRYYEWAWPLSHMGGENILFADGHITWESLNGSFFDSDDPWKNQ